MSEIKAIGFDLGGVIIPNTIESQIRTLAEHIGADYDELEIAMWDKRPQLEVGTITERAYWEDIIDGLRLKDVSSSELRQWWSHEYAQHNPIDSRMMNLVLRIKKAGYKVGLLSNIDIDHGALNRDRHIFQHFDTALLSFELGLRKPDRAAFQALADGLSVSFPEMAFVDDKPENVEGASHFGIHGLQFTSYEQLLVDLVALGITT